VRAPDLVKVYDTLQNAALLNYYFFHPAHEESLAGCTNTEGVEFGCFAGQWGCLSLLLERADANSGYRPSYIGTSARLLAAPSMMAQAADDDDTAKRTVMTVNAFSKATLNDGHPRIFVAKGSHALYLAPGSYAVAYPNESHPNFCGGFEGIPPPPAQPETHLADNPLAAQGLFWAKVAAGSSLLGALGAAAGAIWGIVEYAEANHGLNVVGTGSPGAGRRRQSRDGQNGATGRGHRARCRRRCAELDVRARPHDRRTALRLHRRPQHAAVVARRFQSGRLYGPLGTARRDRSLRPARRRALPSFLAPLLPGVCQRESVRCALNGARAGPVPAAGSGHLYAHCTVSTASREGAAGYVTVWRRSRVKSRLPATG
jgi:hypothetical protein